MSDSLRTVSPLELALFTDRIGKSLAERPLDLDAVEHRERVAALLREVGGATFYQLLEVGPAASPEKVHEGYERTARMVHPSHAPSLGLAGMEDVLGMLFERATAAYITLSHPGRRRDYDREMGPHGWREGSASANQEENRDRARAHYNRATEYVAKDEFHFAIELLREAVRLDPQAKYYALLADMQEKNRNWLHHAADSYQKALELGGPDPRIEGALARVQRRMEGSGSAAPSSGGGGGAGEGPAGGGGARPGEAAGPGGAPDAAARGGRGAVEDPVFDAGDSGDIDPDDTQVNRWLRRRP